VSLLNLVFGTVNGESEFVAREMAGYLCAAEVPHRLWEAEELEGWLPPQNETLVIVCSSTGYGDLPDSIFPWYLSLEQAPSALFELEYGLIGLGDSSYDIFNGGIEHFERLFSDLGAKRIRETLKLDATVHYAPEKDALSWLQALLSDNR
jgi:flavodoxin